MKKLCLWDSKEFDAVRATARFCSSKCRVEYGRMKATLAAKTLDADVDPGAARVEQARKKLVSVTVPATGETFAILPEGAFKLTAPKKNIASIAPVVTTPEETHRQEMDAIRGRMNERLKARGLPLIMEKPEVLRFVATGIPALDSLTADMDVAGVGGLPRKHITEIYGPKGSGKSSLVKSIIGNDPSLKILFFDAEGGLTAPPENINIVKGNIAEDIMSTLIDAVEADEYDLIILDSVASLVTKKHFDDDPEGKASMARAFGPGVKRLVAHLQPIGDDGYPADVPGTAVVFINQFRSSTQSFGIQEYTVGGKALEYYASMRLCFRSAKADYIIRNGKLAGQNVRVHVDKTRFGIKDMEVKYPIMFSELRALDDIYVERLKEMGLK